MFLNKKKVTLRELVEKEQVFAPCVYDCFSARAAEICGYKAALLTGGGLNGNMVGMPDMAFLNIEELIIATDRICRYTPLPIIVDADDGYAESPAVVYYNVKRLVQAGAMAVTIEDSTGIRGYSRLTNKDFKQSNLVSEEVYLAKIKAAVDACKGSDCMVIARTALKYSYGLEKAMDRCNKAMDLGADMTLIVGINRPNSIVECKRIGEVVRGPKMYPDVGAVSSTAEPEVVLSEIVPYGFSLVTMHCFEGVAMNAMVDRGLRNIKSQTNVELPSEVRRFPRDNSANEILEYEKECYDEAKKLIKG